MTITKHVTELLPGPLKVAADLLVETIGPPDLEKQAIQVLQEDVVRLYKQMQDLRSRLSDELMAKLDVVEAFELVTQTVANMGRTASRERREMMANVLVHGLEDVDADKVEKRLFVRAVNDLDVAHIDLLRRLGETMKQEYEWDATEHDRILANDLLRHGLLVDHDPFFFEGEGFGNGTGSGYGQGDGSGYGGGVGNGRPAIVSPRGRRFLAYVADPASE